MASKKKLLQAAAGSAGGAGLDVDEVFSTYLWDGNGSSQTIVNGIDLSGEGGLVWYKGRDTGGLGASQRHSLYDTERGATKRLRSDSTSAEQTESTALTAFNSNGFTIGGDAETNQSNYDYVSWTFRKAPKFYDVVTFSTTTGSSTPITVNHNLGSVPGIIIVKTTNITGDWFVFHRSLGSTKYLDLGSTDQAQTGGTSKWASAPTSTSFTLGGDFVQNATYVAYLFAHNDSGDGEFGPDSDQDIIKCGSYTGNASYSSPPTINLGFEPQLVKCTSDTGDWFVVDNMRGVLPDGGYPCNNLYWNKTDAETLAGTFGFFANGFTAGQSSSTNGSGRTFIYMAIRRGPLAAPDDATKVFALDDSSTTDFGGYTLNSNFPVDFYFFKNKAGGDSISIPRLTIGDLRFNTAGAEDDRSSVMNFDSNTGVTRTSFQGNIDSVDYAFRRAPSYFDVVAWTGTGSARTLNHNLVVAPEMIWVKRRSSTEDWTLYLQPLGNTKYLQLNSDGTGGNSSSAGGGAANIWNDTDPTSSVFSIGTHDRVNTSGQTYIAYLFATLAGVSKVGSYTGNSSTQNIDCGFSNGARFLIIKRTDSTGNWYVWDSVRGIGASSDPYLYLNAATAEQTSDDYISANSSGFTINAGGTPINENSASYIFYAIA